MPTKMRSTPVQNRMHMTRRGTSQLRRTKRRLSASPTVPPTNILTSSAPTHRLARLLRHRDVIHHVTRRPGTVTSEPSQTDQLISTGVNGGRTNHPKFGVGTLMQIDPRFFFQKNTDQNSLKRHFKQTLPPVDATPRLNQAFRIHLCVPRILATAHQRSAGVR